jgi:hypothetical protein
VNHKQYFKWLFLSTGIYVGPIVTALSIVGLTWNVAIDFSMMYAFLYGFTAFLGGVYMLKAARYRDREDIVVDVDPEGNGGEE